MDITRYRIKEDWIWDRQRSERYVRIIGIAPFKEGFDSEGESMGYSVILAILPRVSLRVC